MRLRPPKACPAMVLTAKYSWDSHQYALNEKLAMKWSTYEFEIFNKSGNLLVLHSILIPEYINSVGKRKVLHEVYIKDCNGLYITERKTPIWRWDFENATSSQLPSYGKKKIRLSDIYTAYLSQNMSSWKWITISISNQLCSTYIQPTVQDDTG